MFKNRPTSKFRHMFGKAAKTDQCYNGLRVSKNTWEANFCHVNPKFLAIITEAGSGAAFIVIPIEKVGRLDINHPMVCGHQGAVLDVKWNPFDDNMIASASEDCTAKVWAIPDGGISDNLEEPLVTLRGHQRKVTHVLWHPCASNILITAAQDKVIFVWNLENPAAPVYEMNFPDIIFCLSFSYDGSRLAATFKDKTCRVVDMRRGEILQEWSPHSGTKPSQCVFLKDGKVFTTGFEKMSERRYALWDLKDVSKPLDVLEIDTSNGVLFPYYDCDIDVMYLCGKGDSTIRYYEEQETSMFYLNNMVTKDGARGLTFMPKRGLDMSKNEIAKVYKLHALKGVCEVISFTVPRVADNFQGDLYPDTLAPEPALSADEWLGGKNKDPPTMDCKSIFDAQSIPLTQVPPGQALKDRLQTQITSALGPGDRRPSGGQAAQVVPVDRRPSAGCVDSSRRMSANDNRSQAPVSSGGGISTANGNVSKFSTPQPAPVVINGLTEAAVEKLLAPLRGDIQTLRTEQIASEEKVKKLKTKVKVLEAKVSLLEANLVSTIDRDSEDSDALV